MTDFGYRCQMLNETSRPPELMERMMERMLVSPGVAACVWRWMKRAPNASSVAMRASVVIGSRVQRRPVDQRISVPTSSSSGDVQKQTQAIGALLPEQRVPR